MRKMRITHGIYYAPAPGTKGFKRILWILFGAFALGGLVFAIVGGIWLETDRSFYASAKTTQGEIAEILTAPNGEHRPIVCYTVDGAEYTVRLKNYTSSMQAGDTLAMYYAPEAPQDARNKTYFGGTIFLCIGGGFFLLGAGALGIFAAHVGKKRRLIEKGGTVSAHITAVRCKENMRVNGRMPYYVVCETNAVPALTGKCLKSRCVYEPLPQSLVGEAVRVYFDPAKPTRYLVDTDTLPKTNEAQEALWNSQVL